MRGRMHWVAPLLAGTAATLVMAGPVLACGGLIGPNGGVKLDRTSTLVAYHDGIEHYVTAFTFSGGTGNFGSITPLPAVPTNIAKGGDWTLQRLEREVNPPEPRAFGVADSAARAGPSAEVLQQVQVGALDITVLKGGGASVGEWAKESGFSLPPDAPQLLDFYANRSQIFMAARFNADRSATQAQGTVTSIDVTMPTANPWLPLAILTLGKQPTDEVTADAFLLTDRAPAMLPAPVVIGTGQTSTNGLTLAASEPASASLIADLRSDKGTGWIPASNLWLTYLKLDTPAVNLHYDLAMDVTGANAPSPRAAGLPSGVAAAPAPVPTGSRWVWILAGAGAALLLATWGLAWWRAQALGGGRPA